MKCCLPLKTGGSGGDVGGGNGGGGGAWVRNGGVGGGGGAAGRCVGGGAGWGRVGGCGACRRRWLHNCWKASSSQPYSLKDCNMRRVKYIKNNNLKLS